MAKNHNEVPPEVVEFIRPWALNGICEIGAGAGIWIDALNDAGIETIGYDVLHGIWHEYNHPKVRHGDHIAASEHSHTTMLAVWPPDGNKIQSWIKEWKGDTIILCVHKHRAILGDALDNFKEVARFPETLVGVKGLSTLAIYERR